MEIFDYADGFKGFNLPFVVAEHPSVLGKMV